MKSIWLAVREGLQLAMVKDRRWKVLIRSWVIGLVVVLSLLFVIGLMWSYLESRNQVRLQWPTAQGIISASSYRHPAEGSDSLVVDFSYEVGGMLYVGRDTLPVLRSGKVLAGKGVVVGVYTPASPWEGKILPVHYNPANHADAFVFPPDYHGSVEGAIFWSMIICFALAFFVGIIGGMALLSETIATARRR